MLELTKPINAGHKIPVTIYFNNYIYIILFSSVQPQKIAYGYQIEMAFVLESLSLSLVCVCVFVSQKKKKKKKKEKRNCLIILVQKNIFHIYLPFLLEKFLFLAKFKEIHIHFFFLSISLKSIVI